RRTDQANVAESGPVTKHDNSRGQEPPMSVLSALTDALASATVEIVDLTAPLSSSTPVLKLPPPFSNTVSFSLQEISRFDDRGPAWYWNDITTREHTGTHFDAPCHWVTGRDREDVSQVPAGRLIAPAVVLDFSAQAAADPDFLLEVEHIRDWERAHGPLPDGGWLLFPTGWGGRSTDPVRWRGGDRARDPGPLQAGERAGTARAGGRGGGRAVAGAEPRGERHGGGARGPRRGVCTRVRPAVPVPRGDARGGQVRPHPAAEPGVPAGHGRGADRHPAADRRRGGPPPPGPGARWTVPIPCWAARRAGGAPPGAGRGPGCAGG